jgi:hypothetical protein
VDVSNSSFIDLADNDMILDYAGASPLASVASLLASSGIRSSLADDTHALGYADNTVTAMTSFSGQSVDPTTVLIKYTYVGDTNLDGQVDITDLGNLASAWQTSSTWTGGDFNHDGSVDVADLGMLATNWQAGVGSPLGPSFSAAAASVGLPLAAVPEPGLATLLWCALLLPPRMARRR